MNVEVCYAEAARATRIAVTITDPATVADAVERSGIAALLGLDMATLSFAVFGRRATAATALVDGDRVELLRPLRVDPMEARRRRVARKRAQAPEDEGLS